MRVFFYTNTHAMACFDMTPSTPPYLRRTIIDIYIFGTAAGRQTISSCNTPHFQQKENVVLSTKATRYNVLLALHLHTAKSFIYVLHTPKVYCRVARKYYPKYAFPFAYKEANREGYDVGGIFFYSPAT